jgi:hypothetical protein
MSSLPVGTQLYQSSQAQSSFTIPGGGNEKYWMKVAKSGPNKGKIELWNSQILDDRRIGVLDSKTGKWDFNEAPLGIGVGHIKVNGKRVNEMELLTNQNVNGQSVPKFIIDKAQQLIIQDELQENPGDVDEARKTAEETVPQNEALNSEKDNLTSELNKKGTVDSAETRRKFGTFVYPETLRQDDQDVIKFTILEYKPKGFKARANKLDFFGERSIMKDRTSVGTIVLPIPANIGDANSCDWGEDSMNAVQAAMANIGINFLTGADIAGTITDTAKGVQANKESVKDALGSAVVEAATGASAGALLSRSKGVIMNPNMELLFKKPQLRPFNFTFKLAPRNHQEAMTVINIIRTFKQSMAPIRSQSNLFLKTPHTYRLQYMSRGKVHPFLNMFKECALTNLSMKYTPDGNYATYEDGVMSSYEMTMQFKELEPVFNDDYEQSSASSIGEDTDMDWDTADAGKGRMTTKIGY